MNTLALEERPVRTRSHGDIACDMAREWARLHRQHVQVSTPVDIIRADMLIEQLEEIFLKMLQHHDFGRETMSIGGEFHPDARLMTAAATVGIENPLDAFPPHTVMVVDINGFTVSSLPSARKSAR